MASLEHGRLTRRAVLAAGAGLAALGPAGALQTSTAATAQATVTSETTNLGTAVSAFTVFGAIGDGSRRLFLGSRNLSPAVIATYSLESKTVTGNVELPTADGFVQGMSRAGNLVYAGTANTSSADNFWRYNAGTGAVTKLPRIPLEHVRDLAAAPDGTIYAVGRPNLNVYEYDPATGAVTDRGAVPMQATQIRSVSATDTTVFLGMAGGLGEDGHAALVAMDRATGALTDITPPELLPDTMLYWQQFAGSRLIVGTDTTGGVSGRIAVINLEDYSDYQIVHPIDATHYGPFDTVGDVLYFLANDGVVRSYDMGTGATAEIATPLPLTAGQALIHVAGELVGIGFTAAWTLSLSTGEVSVQNLMDAGAAGGPQEAMSIAASDRKVYVAGTGIVGIGDVEAMTSSSLLGPSEMKDMTFVGSHRLGELWMAQYGSNSRLWRHVPGSGEIPLAAATMPAAYNRPVALEYDEDNDLVVALIRSDTLGNQLTLAVFNPATEEVRHYPNPIGGNLQASLAVLRGIAYLGGLNGLVVAWDHLTGAESWRVTGPGGGTVMGLAARGCHITCTTTASTMFVASIGSRSVVHSQASAGVASSRLAAGSHAVYGANRSRLFRIDPITYEIATLVDGLNGYWFGNQYVAARGRDVYTLQGSDIIRVRDTTP